MERSTSRHLIRVNSNKQQGQGGGGGGGQQAQQGRQQQGGEQASINASSSHSTSSSSTTLSNKHAQGPQQQQGGGVQQGGGGGRIELSIIASTSSSSSSTSSTTTLASKHAPPPSSGLSLTPSKHSPTAAAVHHSLSKLLQQRKGSLIQRAISVRVILIAVVMLLVISFGVISRQTTLSSLQATTSDFTQKILLNIFLRLSTQVTCFFAPSHFLINSVYLQLGDNITDLSYDRIQPILWRVWREAEGRISGMKIVLADGGFYAYFGSINNSVVAIRYHGSDPYSYVGPVTNQQGLSDRLFESLDYDVRVLGWWKKLAATKQEVWSDGYRVVYPPPYETVQVYYANAFPIVNPQTGEFLGAIVATATSFSIRDFLSSIQVSPNAKLWMMEESGAMISCNDPTENVYSNTPNITYAQQSNIELIRETTSRILAKGASANSSDVTFKLHGAAIDAYAFRINYGINAVIVVAYPKSDFLGVERTVKKNLLVITASSLIIALVIGVSLIMFLITKPLAQLGRQMIDISIGKFDDSMFHRSNSRLYEIHSLQQDFYRMVTAIKSFGKFVPKEIVRHLLIDDVEAEASVTQKEVTVMFSDIKGFTQKAEEMTPSQLSLLLSDYLSEMCAVIGSNRGTVDKFIGDAIMALWNVPSPTRRHAHLACAAALESLKSLEDLNMKWDKMDLPELQSRIGIHTGRALVGNLGSKERLAYTAVGDNINLASRLESLNKKYETSVSFSIKVKVYEIVQQEFMCRYLDTVVVQGRTTPTQIYELVCKTDEASIDQMELCRTQAKAVDLFFKRKFNEALSLLYGMQAKRPHDISIKLLIERALEAQSIEELPEDWTGYRVLDEK